MAAAQHHSRPAIAPFYIYEEVQRYFDVRCAAAVDAAMRSPEAAAKLNTAGYPDLYQKGAEVLLPRHLANHKSRTYSPEKAQAFVVPAYLGLNGRRLCGNRTENLAWFNNFLVSSSWFRRRNGLDHIIVTTDHAAVLKPLQAVTSEVCWGVQTSEIIFYKQMKVPHEHLITVPLVASQPDKAPPPWNSRRVMLFFGGQTHGAAKSYVARRMLCKFHFNMSNIIYSSSSWVKTLKKPPKPNAALRPCVPRDREVCSPWYMVPCQSDELIGNGCIIQGNQSSVSKTMARMRKAKFNLAWPGDHGWASVSSRAYDGFAAGNVNVFLGRKIIDSTIAFHRHLPWPNMSWVVGEIDFAIRHARAVEDAVTRAGMDDQWVRRARSLMRRHAPDVLWNHPHSRVAENVLRACEANRRAKVEGKIKQYYKYMHGSSSNSGPLDVPPTYDLW